MAMMETRVLGFHVIQTSHLQDTVRHLKGLHRRIVQRTFPQAFTTELPTFSNYSSSSSSSSRRRRQRRPTSLLEMVFDGPPVPPLNSQRFMTYGELKAKVEMDREAGTRTSGAVYMAMCMCDYRCFIFSLSLSLSLRKISFFLLYSLTKPCLCFLFFLFLI